MKQRLDVLLTERNLAPSREAAKRLIMAGTVYVGGQKRDKAGEPVSPDAEIEVRSDGEKFVSRGGHKLEKALACFPFSMDGKICMDIGASTGGFTDCMLQRGAARVYAVDVGYGQLAWKLREDPRVVNLERQNIRYLPENAVPEPLGFVSIDVSFISLSLVLPVAYRLLAEGGECAALVKPQFEAGREQVGKNGVVRSDPARADAVEKAVRSARDAGFSFVGMEFSPIKGPKGNVEFLLGLRRGGPEIPWPGRAEAEALVRRAREELE